MQPEASAPRLKELKAVIPIEHHVRLQSLKLLTGKTISEAVSEALTAYFAARGGQPGRARVAAVAEIRGKPEFS